jgi:hypothetical protein
MCDNDYYEGICEMCEETKQVIKTEQMSQIICDDCFDENYGRCNCCDDKYVPNEMPEEYEGWCYCCWEYRDECEDCENVFEKEELEHGFCEDCRVVVKKAVVKCFPKILKLVEDAQQVKKPKLKIVCDHKWECGCNKEICEECVERGKETWELCGNEDCCMYYEHRNDKCGCNGRDCGFCVSRR